MDILLLRPDPGNERFGLGPFFRTEPLGLEYIATPLLRRGHKVTIADLRFTSVAKWMRRTRPDVVGISCTHALEYDRVVDTARAVRMLSPDAFIVVGGHAASAYSDPLFDPAVDAVCIDDGEETVPMMVEALAHGRSLSDVPALLLRTPDGFTSTGPLEHRPDLDAVPLPARELVQRHRHDYSLIMYRPLDLLETARGCPYRCSFCSVWQLYGRSFRERSIGAVVEDFRRTGPNVFVADDLFWNHPPRSRELARALKKAGVKKRWMLVQSRTDTVARRPDLLEEWRSVSDRIDIFFGLEAATDSALAGVTKDATVDSSVEAIEVARSMDYGVTGNFVIDPDWGESEFEDLWAFLEQHAFERCGFTFLTPLPGTLDYERMRHIICEQPWFKFDMHHLLWEPRVGVERFFELYAETWRRTVLNMKGTKGGMKLLSWLRQVRPTQIPFLLRVMMQTQRLMRPKAYMAEHRTALKIREIAPWAEAQRIHRAEQAAAVQARPAEAVPAPGASAATGA